MKKQPFDFDVAIAGAGPGGTMAALRLAEAGYSVGLFDALEERGLGRSLVLETEPTVYSRVGLPFPTGDMVAYEIERMRFFSPRGRELFVFEEREHALPVAINLDVLVKDLLARGKKAGVRFFPGTRIDGPLTDGERVTGLACRSKARGARRVKARLTVDATGFSAALVRALPASFGFDFPESSRHVVSAVNLMHRLDPNSAELALGAGLFSPEEILARMGVAGSYSTVYSYLSKNTGLAYLLVGVKRDYEGVQSARQVAEAFTEKAGCFGKKIRAAAAHIRIRHSLDRMATGGFMVMSRGWLGLSATGNYFYRQEQEAAYNLLSGEYMDVPILPFDYSPIYVRNISIGAPSSSVLLEVTIDGSDEYEEKLVSNVQIGTGAYQLSIGNGCNAIRLLDDVIGSSIGNGVQKLTIDSSNGSITIGDNVNTAYLQNCVDGTVIDEWAGKVDVETDSNVWVKGNTQYISARKGSAMNIAEYSSQNITFGERVSYITTSPGGTMKEYVTRDIVYSGADGSISDVVGGGSVTITGGAGVDTGNGGSVTLAAGTANGSGEHGDLYLQSDRTYLTAIMGSPSLSACGTDPSITGGNTLGTVTLGTGSPTSCTLTFAVAWASTPSCVITPLGDATVYISAQSASAITVTGSASFSGFNYVCFGG